MRLQETKQSKRLKFVMKDGGAWCFEVSDEFDLRMIERKLNESLDEFVRLELESEEFLVRCVDVDFVDLGYELIGSY